MTARRHEPSSALSSLRSPRRRRTAHPPGGGARAASSALFFCPAATVIVDSCSNTRAQRMRVVSRKSGCCVRHGRGQTRRPRPGLVSGVLPRLGAVPKPKKRGRVLLLAAPLFFMSSPRQKAQGGGLCVDFCRFLLLHGVPPRAFFPGMYCLPWRSLFYFRTMTIATPPCGGRRHGTGGKREGKKTLC